MLETIYNIKKDRQRIEKLQHASLDNSLNSGYKIENDLLIGSAKWFEAIENGQIKKRNIKGTISRIYMTGHNDYPEFEVDSQDGKTTWTREGIESAYVVGRQVEVIYVEQKFKRPIAILGSISKCVLLINIDINS